MSTVTEKHQRRNNSQEIYNILKERILNLIYKPGYPLSAASISKEFQISRSPAREALLTLASNSLVDIFPQIGTIVSLINLDKVSEERFLRISLEKRAIHEFIKEFNESTIVTMEKMITLQKTAIEENNIVNLLFWDDSFHRELFTSINKPDCWKLLNEFNSNEYRLRLMALSTVSKTMKVIVESHETFLRALKEKNEITALNTSYEHLTRISGEIATLAAKYPEIFTCNGAKVLKKQKDLSSFPDNYLFQLQKEFQKDNL